MSDVAKNADGTKLIPEYRYVYSALRCITKAAKCSLCNSHPIHPATVHFPIAFLMLSNFLDITYGAATHPSTSKLLHAIYDFAPFLADIARFSHYLNIIGIITAVPAVATGVSQLLDMIKKQDLANKLQKSENKTAVVQRMHPKLKVAFIHAALNDIAVAGSVYNWWTRSTLVGNAPTNLNVILSAALLVGISFSGYLGGVMTYDYGVGVNNRLGGKTSKAE
ncbi:hypothetical protein EJ08DRAFT_147007 [Tothia fuscella]|uniref:DUF2231 domain-containing protein n=1 Tax=Tothia fuscella TaxID=1048955 RepID=A0A9P4P3X1_9PEZI|nr:hypothetical protein EJ08DRAFT_147007 [Tothia fuscella]